MNRRQLLSGAAAVAIVRAVRPVPLHIVEVPPPLLVPASFTAAPPSYDFGSFVNEVLLDICRTLHVSPDKIAPGMRGTRTTNTTLALNEREFVANVKSIHEEMQRTDWDGGYVYDEMTEIARLPYAKISDFIADTTVSNLKYLRQKDVK